MPKKYTEELAKFIIDEEDKQLFISEDQEYDVDRFKSIYDKLLESDKKVAIAVAEKVIEFLEKREIILNEETRNELHEAWGEFLRWMPTCCSTKEGLEFYRQAEFDLNHPIRKLNMAIAHFLNETIPPRIKDAP